MIETRITRQKKINTMFIYRRISRKFVAAFAAAIVFAMPAADASDDSTGRPLAVESVVLRLLEEAEVPAQEAGVVTSVAVREGQRVKQGEVLAQIDDQVARLAAEAVQAQYDIARAKAANDVRLRFAKKSLEVSEAELRRSMDSIERFAKSISQSQLDVERLTVQKNQLEAEQAEHEHQVAVLEMKAQDNELSAARAQVARRRIVTPFDGVIVQIYVRRGEWVEPGQKALRIVNVDRLKAEGFVPAAEAVAELSGKSVSLEVDGLSEQSSVGGTIVFVSPEVDPITGQVRVWAEIDNREGKLRPGQSARMAIIE
ncbi:MAG TPA: HlyD family efflux transporter periplasmic adaptor subunit [Lacipirellulaceae bacterium]